MTRSVLLRTGARLPRNGSGGPWDEIARSGAVSSRGTPAGRRFTPLRESALPEAQPSPAGDWESWHAARAVNHSSKRTLGKTCRSAAPQIGQRMIGEPS